MQCHLYWHNALQLVFKELCTLSTWISSARYLNSRKQLTTTKEKKKKKNIKTHATIKNYHIHSCWSLAPVHKLNVQVVQSLLQSKFQCKTLQFFLIQLCWFNIIPKMMYKTRSVLFLSCNGFMYDRGQANQCRVVITCNHSCEQCAFTGSEKFVPSPHLG